MFLSFVLFHLLSCFLICGSQLEIFRHECTIWSDRRSQENKKKHGMGKELQTGQQQDISDIKEQMGKKGKGVLYLVTELDREGAFQGEWGGEVVNSTNDVENRHKERLLDIDLELHTTLGDKLTKLQDQA